MQLDYNNYICASNNYNKRLEDRRTLRTDANDDLISANHVAMRWVHMRSVEYNNVLEEICNSIVLP